MEGKKKTQKNQQSVIAKEERKQYWKKNKKRLKNRTKIKKQLRNLEDYDKLFRLENRSKIRSEKKRILYIDDEKDFLLLTKLRLERSGEFEVITTTDSEEGMELAKKFQPDLILMDVIMPGLGGGRVAEILLDDVQTKRIPILFFSVLANDISPRKGKLRKIGGRDFISKTAGYQELIRRIRNILC